MSRKMFWIILAALSLLATAGPALAACPDIVSCRAKVQVGGTWGVYEIQEVGKIHVDTCWKIGHGCRPWHCDGAPETNRLYWSDQCVQRIPQCTTGNECEAKFPGAPNQ